MVDRRQERRCLYVGACVGVCCSLFVCGPVCVRGCVSHEGTERIGAGVSSLGQVGPGRSAVHAVSKHEQNKASR